MLVEQIFWSEVTFWIHCGCWIIQRNNFRKSKIIPRPYFIICTENEKSFQSIRGIVDPTDVGEIKPWIVVLSWVCFNVCLKLEVLFIAVQPVYDLLVCAHEVCFIHHPFYSIHVFGCPLPQGIGATDEICSTHPHHVAGDDIWGLQVWLKVVNFRVCDTRRSTKLLREDKTKYLSWVFGNKLPEYSHINPCKVIAIERICVNGTPCQFVFSMHGGRIFWQDGIWRIFWIPGPWENFGYARKQFEGPQVHSVYLVDSGHVFWKFRPQLLD